MSSFAYVEFKVVLLLQLSVTNRCLVDNRYGEKAVLLCFQSLTLQLIGYAVGPLRRQNRAVGSSGRAKPLASWCQGTGAERGQGEGVHL